MRFRRYFEYRIRIRRKKELYPIICAAFGIIFFSVLFGSKLVFFLNQTKHKSNYWLVLITHLRFRANKYRLQQKNFLEEIMNYSIEICSIIGSKIIDYRKLCWKR